jgi:hypothetical protein
MMTILALVVACTLALIAGLHLFWAFGGSWGSRAAIPTKEDGRPIFSPSPFACVVVAGGLLAVAWMCIAHFALSTPIVSVFVASKLFWVLGAVFALRVLGDFRYVGLFRRVRGTDFAMMDAKFYSPLCAVYSAAFIAFALA